MPIFKNRTVFEIYRDLKVFLNLDFGATRGEVPRLEPPRLPEPAVPKESGPSALRVQEELVRVRRQLERRESELARLRARLAQANGSANQAEGVRPENMIWIFGSGRTGSTWLSHLMTELEGHTLWGEPLVGKLFADLYYGGTGRQQSQIWSFILSDPYKDVWLNSIRNFVLDGANARFPQVTGPDNYLLLSEPNGSMGAPLLSEALPESRVVFLMRDPRDVVSSFLAASKKGSWLEATWGHANKLADQDPDAYVKQRANWFMQQAGNAHEAYNNHTGPKVLVRYEDLRRDTLQVLQRIYTTLGIDIDQEKLPQVVEKWAWENIPTDNKGEGKFFRKATPGGWQEDLTPQQAKMVEQITGPLLKEFYPVSG